MPPTGPLESPPKAPKIIGTKPRAVAAVGHRLQSSEPHRIDSEVELSFRGLLSLLVYIIPALVLIFSPSDYTRYQIYPSFQQVLPLAKYSANVEVLVSTVPTHAPTAVTTWVTTMSVITMKP
jgi:hypothetical protein